MDEAAQRVIDKCDGLLSMVHDHRMKSGPISVENQIRELIGIRDHLAIGLQEIKAIWNEPVNSTWLAHAGVAIVYSLEPGETFEAEVVDRTGKSEWRLLTVGDDNTIPNDEWRAVGFRNRPDGRWAAVMTIGTTYMGVTRAEAAAYNEPAINRWLAANPETKNGREPLAG